MVSSIAHLGIWRKKNLMVRRLNARNLAKVGGRGFNSFPRSKII